MISRTCVVACVAFVTVVSSAAGAAAEVVYSEALNGDLADGGAELPTLVAFGEGSNTVAGSVSTGTGDTRDFLTFTIDPGFQLSSILQLEYDDPALAGSLFDGNRGFYALLAGVSGVIPTGGFENLGGNHHDPIGLGADLLPAIAGGGISGGDGFTIPLGAGTYTFLVQQTGPQVSGYSLDFVVARVPEPTTTILLALGLAAAAARRALRRR